MEDEELPVSRKSQGVNLEKRPIYHMTPIKNLKSILHRGELLSHALCERNNIEYCDIAYPTLQNTRARTLVPIGPRGDLHDYVPFYFAPKSPMLYLIHKGGIPSGVLQEDIVFFVTSPQRIQEARQQFVFSNGHAIMEFSQFYDSLANLCQIDWKVIEGTDFNDTPADQDCRRRRQAEFLVYERVPLSVFHGVAVYDELHALKVCDMVAQTPHKVVVKAKPNCYYC